MQARYHEWAIDRPAHGAKKAPASAESKQQTKQQAAASGCRTQGALNSEPVARLPCSFVQCASRKWYASALSRMGHLIGPCMGPRKRQPAPRASSKQRPGVKSKIVVRLLLVDSRCWALPRLAVGGCVPLAPPPKNRPTQGALNSEPRARFPCFFVQCASRKWHASALSRMGQSSALGVGPHEPVPPHPSDHAPRQVACLV